MLYESIKNIGISKFSNILFDLSNSQINSMAKQRTVRDTGGAGRGFTVTACACIASTISDYTLSAETTTAATCLVYRLRFLRRHDRRESDRISPMRLTGGASKFFYALPDEKEEEEAQRPT